MEQNPLITVGALICDGEGNVLMIQTHKWSDKWGIPGGKVKWGEDLVDGLKRETLEETGLVIDNIEFITVQEAIKSPVFYKEAHFILVNYTAKADGMKPGVNLNDEAEDYAWVSPELAYNMDINEYTKVLLQKYLEKIHINAKKT